jgi:hypothetical protein
MGKMPLLADREITGQQLKQDLPLGSLILQCREQTERYLRREENDPSSGYELWRRAIQLRNHEAWEAIYNIYRPFVRNWLQKQTTRLNLLDFEEEALINGVFFRILRFIKADSFDKFPTLAAILKYLQMCCLTEVQDYMRDMQGRSMDVSLEASFGNEENTGEGFSNASRLRSDADVEKDALDMADYNPFWRLVAERLPDKADLLVVYARFVHQMPPREIVEEYPSYFPDVNEVYRRLKNAMWRLKNDEKLKTWFEEL